MLVLVYIIFIVLFLKVIKHDVTVQLLLRHFTFFLINNLSLAIFHLYPLSVLKIDWQIRLNGERYSEGGMDEKTWEQSYHVG